MNEDNVTLVAHSIPDQAKKAVVNNITSAADAEWILVNLKSNPIVIMPSGELSQEKWLDAMIALKDMALTQSTV
jgi:hypothetical protein